MHSIQEAVLEITIYLQVFLIIVVSSAD